MGVSTRAAGGRGEHAPANSLHASGDDGQVLLRLPAAAVDIIIQNSEYDNGDDGQGLLLLPAATVDIIFQNCEVF